MRHVFLVTALLWLIAPLIIFGLLVLIESWITKRRRASQIAQSSQLNGHFAQVVPIAEFKKEKSA